VSGLGEGVAHAQSHRWHKYRHHRKWLQTNSYEANEEPVVPGTVVPYDDFKGCTPATDRDRFRAIMVNTSDLRCCAPDASDGVASGTESSKPVSESKSEMDALCSKEGKVAQQIIGNFDNKDPREFSEAYCIGSGTRGLDLWACVDPSTLDQNDQCVLDPKLSPAKSAYGLMGDTEKVVDKILDGDQFADSNFPSGLRTQLIQEGYHMAQLKSAGSSDNVLAKARSDYERMIDGFGNLTRLSNQGYLKILSDFGHGGAVDSCSDSQEAGQAYLTAMLAT